MEAKSISEVLQIINQYFKDIKLSSFGLYFRGQPSFTDKLIPSIFRQGKLFNGVKLNEKEMYREFRLLKETQGNTFRTTFEWLLLMQHYGVPTRLLDWSQNLFVGLYFAVDNLDVDGSLFVLEPISLNYASDNLSGYAIYDHLNIHVDIRANLSGMLKLTDFVRRKEIKNILNDKGKTLEIIDDKLNDSWWQRTIETPIAIRPPIQNDRIYLQRGVFTLHGGKIIGDDVIVKPTHIEEFSDIHLLKIKIPSDAKSNIQKELKYCGVNEAALFPELEHQSHYILERWTSKTT